MGPRWEGGKLGLEELGQAPGGGAGVPGVESRVWQDPTPSRSPGAKPAQGNLTLFYWKLLAVRLDFVITFEVGSSSGSAADWLYMGIYYRIGSIS